MRIKQQSGVALVALALGVVGCSSETSGGEPSQGAGATGGVAGAGAGGSGGTAGDVNVAGAGGVAGGGSGGTERVEPPKEGVPNLYGAELTDDDNFVYFDDLMAAPSDFNRVTLKTEGIVRVNCNKRGCWMDVRSPGDANSNGLTVRFKDYGFFIPLDSRGASVRIEGVANTTVLSPEDVAHYQSEGYDLYVNEDGTADIVSFTATGVEMWPR